MSCGCLSIFKFVLYHIDVLEFLLLSFLQLTTVFLLVCFWLNDCVCIFVEFCREVTDVQMPQVASVILPEMYKIFTQQNVSSFPVLLVIFI